ncbi:MAG: hypothetical protein ACFFER_18755 [Candidatus Thorarchaeota archaeon]
MERIDQDGILRLILALSERPHYISEIIRRSINPNGFMSQTSLSRYRKALVDLGLILEETEEGPRPRTFLTITEKGRRVAEKLREIEAILRED